MSAQKIDKREFRNALGNFATGVTIITAANIDGGYVGVTANSFNSVSLDPPLVLWSLAKDARSLTAYQAAEFFAVNVLSADQVSLSNHFASQADDKFEETKFELGFGNAPLLDGCAARFQCKTSFVQEGGDHLIFVGEVVDFDNSGRASLIYHRGQYAVSEPHPASESKKDPATPTKGGFIDDYVEYLLQHAADKFQLSFAPHIEKAGLSTFQWRVLASLSERDEQDATELAAMTLIPSRELIDLVQRMETKGLISGRTDEWDRNQERYYLTNKGRERAVGLLAAAKAHEADALGKFNVDDAREFKESLKRLIAWVDADA
jgi:flavin reductase (DIM6/NTAB) family NADH-FMN oxidoreductase RutF/DNA-binding MarR family transcriptional regulator